MRYYTILVIFFLLFNKYSVSQNAQWAHSIKSQGYDEGFDLTTDDAGNVYVSGQIEFLARFDDGFALESAGIHDIFLAKFDKDGNRIWAKRAGSRHGGEKAQSIAVDAAQNVYICGEIDDTSYFDNIQVIGRPANNTFVAKYDPNGSVLWVRHFETDAMNSRGYAITCDRIGNVYACGATQDNVYYNGNLLLTSRGNYDAYVFKFDTDGHFKWIKQIGGTDFDKAYGIAVKDANIYVTGYFAGSAQFSSSVILTGSGGTDVFLAKYDTSGSLAWARKGGGTSFDRGWDVTINTNGEIVCTGEFSDQANFGSNSIHSSGMMDMFLAAYDDNGNALWAVKGGSTEDDIGRGVTHDNSGNLFVVGDYASTGIFPPLQVTANGYSDVFLASYEANGNIRFVKSYGGTYIDRGRGVGVDNDGRIYICGEYNDAISFDGINLVGDTNLDVYIAQITMAPGCVITASATGGITCHGACNGNASVNANGQAPFSYVWSTIPPQNTMIATGLCAGGYIVTVTDGNGCVTTASASIQEPPQLDATASITRDISCYGQCDGSGIINITTGQGPYTFQWSTSPPQLSRSVSNLCDGSYTILITDSAGCMLTKSLSITQPSQLTINGIVTNATCVGCSDGRITIILSGGVSPYNFHWSDGSTIENRSNLTAGNYTLCTVDAYGCSLCDSITVLEVPNGITDINSSSLINIYPNPLKDICIVNLDKSLDLKNYKLELFTVTGIPIRFIPITGYSTTLPIEDLSSGIYFLNLFNKKTSENISLLPLVVDR